MAHSVEAGKEPHRRVLEMMRAYRDSQVLITCARLGVFEALGHQGRTSAELASSLALPPAALARLLNAAQALDLLAVDGEIYRNSPTALACLAPGGPQYLGNLLRRENAFFTRWSKLEEAVRTGKRPPENRAMEDTGDWVHDFEYALYDLARANGPAVAAALDLDPACAWRVLDVGGGHGGYSIALARRCPRLQAVVLDLPPVIAVTREIVATTEVADRVLPHTGDFMQDDLGRDYDLVLLFGVLVSEPPERRAVLLRRTCEALKPGGLLVVREQVLEDNGLSSEDAVLFDLHMLLSTEAGGAIRRQAFIRELQAAGFEEVETRNVVAADIPPLWIARRGN